MLSKIILTLFLSLSIHSLPSFNYKNLFFRFALKPTYNLPKPYKGKINLREMLQRSMNEYNITLLPTPELSSSTHSNRDRPAFLFLQPETSYKKHENIMKYKSFGQSVVKFFKEKDRKSTIERYQRYYIAEEQNETHDKIQIENSLNKHKDKMPPLEGNDVYLEGVLMFSINSINVGSESLPKFAKLTDEYEIKDMKNMYNIQDLSDVKYFYNLFRTYLPTPASYVDKISIGKIYIDTNIEGSADILHEIANGFSFGLRIGLGQTLIPLLKDDADDITTTSMYIDCGDNWHFSLCPIFSHDANKWFTFYGWAGFNFYRINAKAQLSIPSKSEFTAYDIYSGTFPTYEVGFGGYLNISSRDSVRTGLLLEVSYCHGKFADVAKDLKENFDKIITQLEVNPSTFRVSCGLCIETVPPAKPKAIASPLGLR
mgnify:FL=1